MAQDLGLNRNCDHWNISPEEREKRKRVFWCCFIVDRITSAIYGRSANFEERDCDVPFPSVDDDELIKPTCKDSARPPAKLLEVFIQSIKICDILGHVLKNIYYAKARQHTSSHHIDMILTTLNQQLTQWHQNLPLSLQYKLPNTQAGEITPDPPSPICQLHMIYYTTVILLHRSFIPGPTQSQLPISLPSYEICESAASSILDIINIMLGENHLKFVYNFSVFFVFTAGIIFIKLASSDEAEKAFDAKININRIMRALDELEITWMNAARCCNILGDLAGLRDIKLECDKYVPKKVNKPSPPPSIAVPNSPEMTTTSTDNDIIPPLTSSPIEMSFNRPPTIDFNNQHHWNQPSPPPPPQAGNIRSSSMSDYSTSQQQQQPQRSSTDYMSNYSSNTTGISSQVPISSVRSSSNHPPPHNHPPQHNTSSSPTFITNTTPTMDPFAAPGIIPGPSTTTQPDQFDPLGTAFWGMPSSLDTDEWNAYFGTQSNTQLLSSIVSPANKSSVVDLPSSPSQSFLLGFLQDENKRVAVDSPNTTTVTVPTVEGPTDARYW